MILDRTQCHPFDENRNGLTIGEGAAYIVLESEMSVRESGREFYGYLSGMPMPMMHTTRPLRRQKEQVLFSPCQKPWKLQD